MGLREPCRIRIQADAVWCGTMVKRFARHIGLDRKSQLEVEIVVRELATNAFCEAFGVEARVMVADLHAGVEPEHYVSMKQHRAKMKEFKDFVIVPLWTKAGPAKIVTWAIIGALLVATPVWVVIALIAWIFIPDADRALNLALRAEGTA